MTYDSINLFVVLLVERIVEHVVKGLREVANVV